MMNHFLSLEARFAAKQRRPAPKCRPWEQDEPMSFRFIDAEARQ